MKDTEISNRKTEQLKINLKNDVSSGITTGLEKYQFLHSALPELDLVDINISSKFLGKSIRFPLLISSMTGGSSDAEMINRNLAIAAQSIGLPMGVGSQRAALEDPNLSKSFQIRDYAPDILVLANIGAIQLNNGYTIDHCKRAVEMIDANALIFHLNPLQEALQTDGDTNWKGLSKKIEEVIKHIGLPVIIKEVGWGINTVLAKRFVEMGVYAIDIAGAGGTSWSQVEMYRQTDPILRELAEDYRDWGIPTTQSLVEISSSLPEVFLIASGGIKNGIDLAKCIGLGADLVGMAGSILKAASEDTSKVLERINLIEQELMISMFSAGILNIQTLKHTTSLLGIKP